MDGITATPRLHPQAAAAATARTAAPVVLVEVSSNGADYSTIFSIGASAESSPVDPGERIHSSLVCATQGTSIRYRTIDGEGNPAVIPGLTFTFIDSSAGPSVGDFPPSISAKAAYDVSAPPALLSRADWGADESFRFEESLLGDDKEMLEDLVAAAFNDANRKVEQTVQAKLSAVTGGLALPGMKLPF